MNAHIFTNRCAHNINLCTHGKKEKKRKQPNTHLHKTKQEKKCGHFPRIPTVHTIPRDITERIRKRFLGNLGGNKPLMLSQ